MKFEVFFIQGPRGVRNDLVDPPTMTDDFTTLHVWAQGEEIVLTAFCVRKYADNEMGLWEGKFCLSKLETLTLHTKIKVEQWLLSGGTLTRH